jgi:hypothetical protein
LPAIPKAFQGHAVAAVFLKHLWRDAGQLHPLQDKAFLDADPRWWQPCSWHLSEIDELAKIDTRFHFHRVAPTVFEILPLDNSSATDQPHLESLLPANRPEEVRKCFNSG